MNSLISKRSFSLAVLAFSAGFMLPLQSMAQALTPDQLTLQVKALNLRSNESVELLNKINKDLQSLSQEVGKMGGMIENQGLIEMLQNVDVLADEVSQLRGEMEQQSYDLNDLKKRQRELYLDIDRRMRDLEVRSTTQAPVASVPAVQVPAQVVAPSIPSLADAPDSSTNIEPTVEVPVADPATVAAGSPEPAITTAPVVPTVTSSEESAAYQDAFDTLKEGRYKQAKIELSTFLERYPSSSFAGNAQYWLGEANYVTRHFDQSIVEFKLVLTRYPASNKVPDSMLKLGYTFYELKQFDQAKAILQDLRNRFPKSSAFRLAGKRLDRIKKEGN